MRTANIIRKLIAPIATAVILTFGLHQGFAQEISQSHIDAAKKAIAAIHATDPFDDFLPSTARDLKNELIRKDPNLETMISDVVDEQALALVKRRGDLEVEAARAYAKHFSEAELNAIAAFYNSDAGKKLLTEGPKAMGDAGMAFNVWSQGIAQDLAANVGKALNEKMKSAPKTAPATATPAAPPATGAPTEAPAQ